MIKRRRTNRRLNKNLLRHKENIFSRLLHKNHKTKSSLRFRFTLIFLLMLLMAGSVVTRAVRVQIIGDKKLDQMASRQFQSRVLLKPRRGGILDREGKPLAVNADTHSLAVDPSFLKNLHWTAKRLSKIFGLSQKRLVRKFKKKLRFVWIKRHLTQQELGKVLKNKGLLEKGELLKGLILLKEDQRVYPNGPVGAHITGSVNIDLDGIEGIELWKNQYLKGSISSFDGRRDGLGRKSFIDVGATDTLKHGKSIYLTIDLALQYEVEGHLKEAIKKTGSKSGTVIVMDAENGEILSTANYPEFDPNKRRKRQSARRNRALTDGFEPGSTMKAVLMASALKNGWTKSDRVWGGLGSFKVQGKRISEAEEDEKFKWVSLERMITVSSNVAAAKIALKLGKTKFLNTLRQFGFYEKTGTGFPGEITGIIPKLKTVRKLNLANFGFGQGLLATPMQMARAYAVFANGGFLVKPTFLLKDESALKSKKRILSENQANAVRDALVTVTGEEGTATLASLSGFQIAGKTGTAQVVDSKTKRYSKTKHIPSFIGFATEVDRKIIILTKLDYPKGKYYASSTAVPLFKAVLESTVKRLKIPAQDRFKFSKPSEKKLAKEIISDRLVLMDSAVTRVRHLYPVKLFKKKNRNEWIVPDFEGYSPIEVMRVTENLPFKLSMEGFGTVVSQNPKPGTLVIVGRKLKIMLSRPKE